MSEGFQPTRNVGASFEFTIHQVVWLFPACIAVHFLEETLVLRRLPESIQVYFPKMIQAVCS